MNQTTNITYRYTTRAECATIAFFQFKSAKETENKDLNLEKCTQAIEKIYDNPSLGFYITSNVDNDDTPQSSQLITYGFDLMRGTNIWWIQSVFVQEHQRGKGLFKGMFQEIERLNVNKYPLKLFVDTNNVRAQQVYQRQGMFDTNYIFLENDFYFEGEVQYAENTNYEFSLCQEKELNDFGTLLENGTLKSLVDKEIEDIEKTKKGIQEIFKNNAIGGVFAVKDLQSSKYTAYIPVYYEYCDWRQGQVLYVYDLRVITSQQQDIQALIASFMNYLQNSYTPEQQLMTVRWVLKETSSFKEELLKVGLLEANYRIYEKANF